MAPRFAEGAAGCNLCHGMLRVLLVTEEVMAGHCAGNCQRSFDTVANVFVSLSTGFGGVFFSFDNIIMLVQFMMR